MTILTSVTEIEDKFVDTLRDIQRPVIDYVRKGVERAEGRIPRLSYPATLPKPGEILDSQVEFAKALIGVQRDFARDLVDAVSPLVEAEVPAAKGPAAKTTAAPAAPASAAKPAAKKTTRKPSTKKS